MGGTVHLQAQPLDASGNVLKGRTVTWSSDNQATATVDNTGVVTGVATGAATITATSEGKTGTAGIAVAAAVPASITVAPPSVTHHDRADVAAHADREGRERKRDLGCARVVDRR